MGIIDSACDWAIGIANDDSHGYDQILRQGPDYDCSSLIITAFDQAGIPVKAAGATYTGNMRQAFMKCGFQAISTRAGIPVLIKGDILLSEKHHTALYIGDGRIVQASINENGKITGGKTGDQTGREIRIGPMYIPSYGWDYILRYTGEKQLKGESTKVNILLTELKRGSRGPEVKTLQILLYAHGFNCGTADSIFGSKTDTALKNYQKANNLKVDGICGKCSWTSILTS